MKTLFVSSTGVFGAIFLVVVLGAVIAFSSLRGNRGSKVLTDILSEPLNGATAAKVDINAGSGNLTIDRITGGEQVLASGTLEYLESLGLPARTLSSNDGQATFTLKMGDPGRSGFRLPWEACNAEVNWQIHLNPSVSTDITAHSGGGNLKLDLTGMLVNFLSADTGGGNVDVVLPANAANLNVTAKTGAGNVSVEIGSGTTGSSTVDATSGAGNVTVSVPSGIAARVHATSGLGKVIVDPSFIKIDASTYQSPDYAEAANKVELTLKSGAGNVIVNPK